MVNKPFYYGTLQKNFHDKYFLLLAEFCFEGFIKVLNEKRSDAFSCMSSSFIIILFHDDSLATCCRNYTADAH